MEKRVEQRANGKKGKCDDCMSTSHFVLHNDNQGNYNWGNLIIHLGTFNYKVGPLKAAVTTAEEKIRRYSNSFSVAIAVYGVVVTRL